jgi:hypothetical protein
VHDMASAIDSGVWPMRRMAIAVRKKGMELFNHCGRWQHPAAAPV